MQIAFRLVIGGALAVIAAPALSQTMPVSTFLAKTDALKKKGPMALFSGDIKRLMNQVKADSAQLRAENKTLAEAGKRKHYCTPEGFKMNQDGIMAAMQEVPAADRARTSTMDALRAYIARRHPCR